MSIIATDCDLVVTKGREGQGREGAREGRKEGKENKERKEGTLQV